MKVTKKLFSFLAIVVAIIALLGTTDIQAADMKNIATNTVVTDSLETSDDVNCYVFTVDKSGYMELEFNKVDPTADAKWGWNVKIFDMNGECLHAYGAVKTSFITYKLNYAVGTQLYVQVYANNNGGAPIGVNYSVKIKTTADATWEQEPNNGINAATYLIPDKAKTGSLIYGTDADYYAYTVDRTGYFTLNFVKVDLASDARWGWDIVMFDEAGAELISYEAVKTNFTSRIFNFKKGTKIYIKLCGNYTDSAPVQVEYRLTVNPVVKSNWEIETLKYENDSWNARIANTSKLEKEVRYGSLWTWYDNDIYKLSVPKTAAVTLKFDPNNVETNLGWGYNLQIFNKKGERVAEWRDIKAAKKFVFNAKKGTYYVQIKAQYTGSTPPGTDAYSISATQKTFTVPSMKSKKITYKSSSDTLKWKKVKKIDGYEIQVCKNKKFKKSSTTIYTSDKTSYVLPWNLPNRTYYVRIAAYKDTVTGERVYGKFTKVKKIKKR